MKVVILAAGFGSRFGDKDLPKPLTVLVNGKSILQLQIEQLTQTIPIHDILIVVGYHKEQIVEKFPDLLFVYNSNFFAENTAKSLLRAVQKIDTDLLWLNGDVVFHSHVLKAILKNPHTSMIVNEGPVGDEEVKYRANTKGQILEVSKHVKNPQGEALGINFCSHKDLPLLRKKLVECANNDYFERAIELGIEEGMIVKCIPVDHAECVEIDFAEDLEKANNMFKLKV